MNAYFHSPRAFWHQGKSPACLVFSCLLVHVQGPTGRQGRDRMMEMPRDTAGSVCTRQLNRIQRQMDASGTEEADWLRRGSGACSVVSPFSFEESLDMVKFAKPVRDDDIDRAVRL